MTSLLFGHHLPADTWLHRMPAGAKLFALLVAGVVVLVTTGPVAASIALGVAVALLFWAGAGLGELLRGLRGIAVVAILLGAWQTWQNGWPAAVSAVGDLIALILLATVLTLTTPIDAMLDALTRLLGPLRRVGVRPDRVALAFSLMLRAVPVTLEIAAETGQAARARGLERSPRARLTPLAVRVVARAHQTGDALHARGLGD